MTTHVRSTLTSLVWERLSELNDSVCSMTFRPAFNGFLVRHASGYTKDGLYYSYHFI